MEKNDHRGHIESPSLSEAADAVAKLAAVLDDHHLAQIEVSLGKLHIRLKAGKSVEQVMVAQTDESAELPIPTPVEAGHIVAAPMIGTFYSAPSPGEPPFVSVGDTVEIGQVIGIIEAMKIMNEITADRAGTVSDVFVSNAQPLEYGSPLIRLTLT